MKPKIVNTSNIVRLGYFWRGNEHPTFITEMLQDVRTFFASVEFCLVFRGPGNNSGVNKGCEPETGHRKDEDERHKYWQWGRHVQPQVGRTEKKHAYLNKLNGNESKKLYYLYNLHFWLNYIAVCHMPIIIGRIEHIMVADGFDTLPSKFSKPA